MPETESNATKSRLEKFIDGCSQLTEIYAVAPLNYTNIMGEWWQRINDIIYTLGLTETQNTPVTIAWTVPVPGRKRSPFFEEEIATKKPDGTEVSEASRVSHVAGTGTTINGTNTKKVKAHKYGLIQSIDKLFQRNIDTWGGMYRYFYNRTHNGDGTLKTGIDILEPADLTEMLFGKRYPNVDDTENAGRTTGITDMFNRACRNLTGNEQGLANSLTHFIEKVIGSNLYDFLDPNTGNTSGENKEPSGLQELLFGTNSNGNSLTEGEILAKWKEMERDGLTADGLVGRTNGMFETIGDDLYDWLNNYNKQCVVHSSVKKCELYTWSKPSNTWTWVKDGSKQYRYRGKAEGNRTIPILAIDGVQYSYPQSGTTVVSVENENITRRYDDIDAVIKEEFINIAKTALNAEYAVSTNPAKVDDIAYASVKIIVNPQLSTQYECTKFGFFVCTAAGSNKNATWTLKEESYVKAISGLYDIPQYAASSPASGQMCLVATDVETLENNANGGPKTIKDLLFGNANICDIWKDMSSGSLVGETQKIKDTIGEDLIELMNPENTQPICGNSAVAGSKPGPHSLKDLLFGSMSTEELCNTIKEMTGDSIINEITNITNYLGDSYYNYYTINNPATPNPTPVAPLDPAVNPMTVLHSMSPGQVLFGSLNEKKEQSWTADYLVQTGYICENSEEALSTVDSLTDQERIFNTYQRVAYTGTGTPFPNVDDPSAIYFWEDSVPFTSWDDAKASSENTSTTNTNVWPYRTANAGRFHLNTKNTLANGTQELACPTLWIYNSTDGMSYALFLNSFTYEDVQYASTTALTPTGTLLWRKNNDDGTRNFNASQLVSRKYITVTSTVNGETVNTTTGYYIFSADAENVGTRWTLNTAKGGDNKQHGLYVTAKSILKATTFLASGSKIDGRTVGSAGETLQNDTTTGWWYLAPGSIIAQGSTLYQTTYAIQKANRTKAEDDALTTYSFPARDGHNTWCYRWSISRQGYYWNEKQYGQTFYRKNFVYVKRNFFHPTPEMVSKLQMSVEVFSNGSIVDSACWDFDTKNNLILLGCNSVAYTGFLSNKKYNNYFLSTRPQSDTDDDDSIGILAGGYKDINTGVVHTLGLRLSYGGNSALTLNTDIGGTNGVQIFGQGSQNGAIHVRSICGKYGFYTYKNGNVTNTTPKRGYTSPASGNGYLKCDPNIIPRNYECPVNANDKPDLSTESANENCLVRFNASTNKFEFPKAEEGLAFATKTYDGVTVTEADAPYSVLGGYFKFNGINYAFINLSKALYQDVHTTNGPSTKGRFTFTINPTTGSSDNHATYGNANAYVYEPYTTTDNGRSSYTEPTKYATNNWNDNKKVAQGVLDILNHNGLIFLRNGCGYDYEIPHPEYSSNAPTAPANRSYIKPWHLSSMSFDQWWNGTKDGSNQVLVPISDSLKALIRSSIKYIFRLYQYIPASGSVAAQTKPVSMTDTIADFILQYFIFPKYQLSTFNFNNLLLDDVFKLYTTDTNLYPTTRNATAPGGTTAGCFFGYGPINCYKKYDLNCYMSVQKKPNMITITYKDIFYEIRNLGTNTNDPGINYINLHHPYQGDIIITLQYNTTDQRPEFTVKQGDYETAVTPITNANAKSIVTEILQNATSYGYMACSNPLSCFKDNIFIDQDYSTIYDLENNIKWEVDKNNNYVKISTDCTAELYKMFGPGRLISNDFTGKLYYTRGDANQIQKIVNGRDEIIKETERVLGYNNYEVFDKTDLKDANGNPQARVTGDGFYYINNCTPGKMVVIAHSNPAGKATACGVRVKSGSVMGLGTHPGAFYRLGTNTLQINATVGDPHTGYTGDAPFPETYTDYSMSFVIIPNATTLVLEVIDMDDDGDVLYVFK